MISRLWIWEEAGRQGGWHPEPQPSWWRLLLTSVLGTPWDLENLSVISAGHLPGRACSTPWPPFSSLCCLYLVGVCVEIEVLQEAGRKFTEEEIVGFVDGPHAPVRVVVGASAGAERPHCQGKLRTLSQGSPAASPFLSCLRLPGDLFLKDLQGLARSTARQGGWGGTGTLGRTPLPRARPAHMSRGAPSASAGCRG